MNTDSVSESAKENIELMSKLMNQKNEMLAKYDFIQKPDDQDILLEKIIELDEEISQIIKKLNNTPKENQDEIQKLTRLQEKYKLQMEILYEYNNLLSKLHAITQKVIASISNQSLSNQPSSEQKVNINEHNYKDMLDNLCIQIYNVPLLVALTVNDPSDIIESIRSKLDFSGYRKDIIEDIIKYIESQKRRIEQNLVLTDNALIDLIETVTGRNIISESLGQGRVLEKSKDNKYSVVYNNREDIGRHTYGGGLIVKFENQNRKATDIFTRDFPNATSEELIFRSFSSLPNERKQEYIRVVLDNLELCYEMYKSYYMNDSIVIPTKLELTNGETMDYYLYRHNLPHLLGICKISDLPERTVQALRLKYRYNDKDILEQILDKKEEIIKNCGLVKDSSNNTYYELLPWEKILLKTNALIRGDYFKSTALIALVNKSVKLFDNKIERISLTGTRFAKSALNQPIPTIEDVDKLRARNHEVDFVVKGMSYDEHKKMWVPQSNSPAMGERIVTDNNTRIKTLERVRRALESTSPEGSGFIARVENEIVTPRDTPIDELAQAIVDIAITFGDSPNIKEITQELVEQAKVYASKKKH